MRTSQNLYLFFNGKVKRRSKRCFVQNWDKIPALFEKKIHVSQELDDGDVMETMRAKTLNGNYVQQRQQQWVCQKHINLFLLALIISWSGFHNVRETVSIKSSFRKFLQEQQPQPIREVQQQGSDAAYAAAGNTTTTDAIIIKITDDDVHNIENSTLVLESSPTMLRGSSPHKRLPLCTREQIIDGSWQPVTLKQPPYISKTTHLRCYPIEHYHDVSWNTYEWQPNHSSPRAPHDTSTTPLTALPHESSSLVASSSPCEFTQWSRKKFCSLMEKVTILIIGDSLSWEHYSSLAQLLGMKVSQFDQHLSKQRQRNHDQYPCKGQTRLVYRRDDILQNLTDAIDQTFPQVIVLNRGAHYVNDTRLLREIRRNIFELKEWKRKCDLLQVKCHLFWRTSVPGHPKCDVSNFTTPNNNLTDMEDYIADKANYNNYTMKYHWYDYQRQNDLVVNEFIQTFNQNDDGGDVEQEEPGIDILDAYYLNIRRPDEHRSHQSDCLHNCYPGKMDVYSQLLLHFLKMRRNRKDVTTLIDFFDMYQKKLETNESNPSQLGVVS